MQYAITKKMQTFNIDKEVLDSGVISVFHKDLKKEPGSHDLECIQERAIKAAHKIEKEVAQNKNGLQSYISGQSDGIKKLYEKIEEQSNGTCDVNNMQRKADKALGDLLQPSSGGCLDLVFGMAKAYGLRGKVSSLNNSVSYAVKKVYGPEKATLDDICFELSNCRTSFADIFVALKNDVIIKENNNVAKRNEAQRDAERNNVNLSDEEKARYDAAIKNNKDKDDEAQKDAVKHLIKFYKAFEDVFYNLKNIAITNEINKDDLLLESSLKHIIKNLDLKTESPDAIMAQGKAISELGLALNTNSARLKAIESKNILPALNLDSSDLFSGVYTYDYGHMLWSRQDNCAQDAIKLLGSTAVICKDIKAYSNTITKYIEDPSSMTDLSSPTGFWNGVAGGFRWTLEIFGEGFSEFFMGEASSGRQLDRLTKQVEKIAAHSPDFVVSIQPIKLEASEARYGVNGDYSIIDNEADEHLDMGYNYPTMAETN